MKKYFLLLAVFLFFCSNTKSQTLKLDKNSFRVIINNVGKSYHFNKNSSTNTIKVYCENPKTEVCIATPKDSITFYVSPKDTFNLQLELNSITFNTQLIGVKEIPNTISLSEKLFYLSLFWSEVKYNFINYDKLNFDWDSLYKENIIRVKNSANDLEYYNILKSFAASLNDAHTEISYGKQFGVYMDYIPVGITNIKNKLYLSNYLEKWEHQLELGSEIIKVNGLPLKEYMVKNVFPYISASTETYKWLLGASKLTYGLKTEPITLTFKKLCGDTMSITFKRDGESTRYDRFENDKHKFVNVNSKYTQNLNLEFTKDSIAILEYNSFGSENFKLRFEKLLPQIYKAKGLIINLRNNMGGRTDVATHLLQYVIKDYEYLNFGAQTKIHNAYYKAQGYGREEYKEYYLTEKIKYFEPNKKEIDPDLKKIKCPIAILIGTKTFSAAEDFLIMLKEINERPVLIGSETGGSTGAPLVLPDFPNGGWARICTIRNTYPYSNKGFVNKGIEPDIKVCPNIQDILENNDVVLNKALEVIRKKLD